MTERRLERPTSVGLVALILVTVTGACSPAPARHALPARPAVEPVAPDAGAPPFVDNVASFDAIAARGSAELPLMREVRRAPEAAARPTEIASDSGDTCFRAVVAANVEMRAWFEDAGHAQRGEATTSLAGLVPPRGPVCARKGETLLLVLRRADPSSPERVVARAVVWQSP